MPYRVFRDSGAPLDAHLDIEGREFIFHGRGATKGTSAAHNIDDGRALRLLLKRIVATGRRVEGAWLDSDRVAHLPRSERIVLRGPDLTAAPADQVRIMSAAMKVHGRGAEASPGGRSVKKLRIRVTGAGDNDLARDLQVGYVANTPGRRSQRLSAETLGQVTAEHIWKAVQRLRENPQDHGFGEPTKFEVLLDDGVRLPPKAVFGVAARYALGSDFKPGNFVSGPRGLAFRAIEAAGFQIVAKGAPPPISAVPISNEDREWTEGRPKLVSHLKRERAHGLSLAKKDAFVREHGSLYCELCGLDPVAVFGSEVGEACIEVHHNRTHVRQMAGGRRTKLEDLQCLCANCHRIAHAKLNLSLLRRRPGA